MIRLLRSRTCRLFTALVCVVLSAGAIAQRTAIPRNEADVSHEMIALARRVLPTYSDNDPARYRDGLFRLQLVAGDYAGALATIDAQLDATPPSSRQSLRERLTPYQLFAAARIAEETGRTFDDAFRDGFREALGALDDKTAFRVNWLTIDVDQARRDFYAALQRVPSTVDLAPNAALNLIRPYLFYSVFRDIETPGRSLFAEDDERRYVQDDVLIQAPDGVMINAVVIRPRRAAGQLPTALTFTIYASTATPPSARRAAAYGYAGVVAYTRGKGRSPGEAVPYEHDGDDARTVIAWIAKQSWSNGAVGMFGGSYEGFTQWAAAKRLPAALRTIVPYVAAIPGLGLPMENNVFLNANYGWTFYVTNNKYLDTATYNDPPRWSSLNANWYASGRRYRELDRVDGTPNKWLQRWLNHPSFDQYWQAMTAYRRDFSHISIPVLSITGYYDDGQISALQYVKEHYKYNSSAEHYLLIGPWDHFGSQASIKPTMLRGYAIDPVAQVDTPEITFQWLDYVLRSGKKPELLVDRINYQEMGTNTWQHASSLQAMSNDTLTLYLSDERSGSDRLLTPVKPATGGSIEQVVDFADRTSETNDYYPGQIVRRRPQLSSGIAFVSEPFTEPLSISGTVSGVLRAQVNKKDLDVGVVVYELMPNGDLLHLTYYIGRASYARDMTTRHLFTPGRVETIPFDRTRLVSRKLQAGSRLLVVVDVNKNRFTQLNYGTGKDVSDESIANARVPLRVQWQNDSYVRIPIRR